MDTKVISAHLAASAEVTLTVANDRDELLLPKKASDIHIIGGKNMAVAIVKKSIDNSYPGSSVFGEVIEDHLRSEASPR